MHADLLNYYVMLHATCDNMHVMLHATCDNMHVMQQLMWACRHQEFSLHLGLITGGS